MAKYEAASDKNKSRFVFPQKKRGNPHHTLGKRDWS